MIVSLGEKVKFISSVFGKVQVAGNAANIGIRCPIPECPSQQKRDKFKLAIRVADDFWHCWVCGQKGRSLLSLIFKYGTREQLAEYKQKYLPEHVINANKFDETKIEERFCLPDTFKLLATELGSSDFECKRAINYLFNDRGLTERDLWFYKFVVSDDWRWKRRVIVPSFDDEGALNYFVGRDVDGIAQFKYKNCDVDAETVVFNELNVDWQKPLVLVEGPFDLVKCNMNATCLLGSNLSEEFEVFNRILLNQTPVILCFDNDVQMKTQKIARMLAQYNVDVKIASVGERDPGAMTKTELEDVVNAAKPWSWQEHVLKKVRGIKTRLTV